MSRSKSKRAPDATPARKRAQSSALVLREQRPAGAGGELQTTVTPAGVALIERVAAKGGSRDVVAAALGVGRGTLQRLIERDEAVRFAWERGLARDEGYHVGVLRKAASKGYAAASMFLLKTRHGYRENDASPTHQTGIQIVLPAAMSHEQWDAHRAKQRALSAPTNVVDVEVTEVKS